MFSLKNLFLSGKKPIVTAHRGFSGKYPENTIAAFEAAYRSGVDIVEFDVRATADKALVILHDETVDRTTDGSGQVSEINLADLQQLNASHWHGTCDKGSRVCKPSLETAKIPTLDEVLNFFSDKDVGLNIQICVSGQYYNDKLCALYEEHKLYSKGFFTIPSFAQAKELKSINPDVEICVAEDRANLQRHKEFGSKIIQPRKEYVNSKFCADIKKLGLWANMFYSNTREENKKYLAMGIQGIMTDLPNLLLQ